MGKLVVRSATLKPSRVSKRRQRIEIEIIQMMRRRHPPVIRRRRRRGPRSARAKNHWARRRRCTPPGSSKSARQLQNCGRIGHMLQHIVEVDGVEAAQRWRGLRR